MGADRRRVLHASRDALVGCFDIDMERFEQEVISSLRARGWYEAKPEQSTGAVLLRTTTAVWLHASDASSDALPLASALAAGLSRPVHAYLIRGLAPAQRLIEMEFSVTCFLATPDGSRAELPTPHLDASHLRHANERPFDEVPDEATFEDALSKAEGYVCDSILESLESHLVDRKGFPLLRPAAPPDRRLVDLADAASAARELEVSDLPDGRRQLRIVGSDGSRRISFLSAEEHERFLKLLR